MFTGLTETTGTIVSRSYAGDAGKLTVMPAVPFSGLEQGESIAVNGACLTLESGMKGGPLTFHVLRETFSRTNLGSEAIGSVVNLERAMRADGRFGGHFVSGHVDACAKILSLQKRDSDMELIIELPEGLERYFVEKGSIAVDGVSLTVEKVLKDSFRIGLIPTTLEHTNLAGKKAGSPVNLETDMIGKYIVSFLERRDGNPGVTMQMLSQAGFL